MFPQYRKLNERDVWYKIVSDIEFHEVTKVGDRIKIELIEAVQYPEKLRIQDMLKCHENYWIELNEKQYLDEFI